MAPNKINLKCQLYSDNGCAGSASVDISSDTLTKLKPHNHPPEIHEDPLIKFKNEFKSRQDLQMQEANV